MTRSREMERCSIEMEIDIKGVGERVRDQGMGR